MFKLSVTNTPKDNACWKATEARNVTHWFCHNNRPSVISISMCDYNVILLRLRLAFGNKGLHASYRSVFCNLSSPAAHPNLSNTLTAHHRILSHEKGYETTHVGFEVFTAVVLKSIIFWDMTPCSPFADLFFDPEDGGDTYLRNVAYNTTDYTASYPRR
jgi:hypothetical protein